MIGTEAKIAKKKVLLVSENNGFRGGIDTFLLNWVKSADQNRFSFIWYFPGKITDMDFINEFKSEGVFVMEGRRIDPWFQPASAYNRIMEKYGILKDIYRILKENKIDIIHINAGHPRWQTLLLPAAAACHIECRIMHGRNTSDHLSPLRRLEEAIGKEIVAVYANRYAACSGKAAQYFFGRKKAAQAMIIKNCTDTKRFAFSAKTRDKYRKEYGLEGKYVVGHVGRFFPQKNHEFLIDIFQWIVKKEPDARLLMVGEGPLEPRIREKAEKYGLLDKVIFTGASGVVQEYMCAMDVFVLPSLYEGFGNVIIEAQSNGLPCVISDVIPEDAAVTELVEFVPLEAGAESWADKILGCRSTWDPEVRAKAYERIREAGYDISQMAGEVLRLYDDGE